MFAIFDTITSYIEKNTEINAALGYPDGHGTERYSTEFPKQDINGKYVMPIMPHVTHLFEGCVVVDTVEYPQEVEDELN